MRFRRDLIRPPKFFSKTSANSPRKVSWLELFYDLIFVVAIAQLANALFRDLSMERFFKFAVMFMTIWWAWVGHTFYLNRFDTDDLMHRLSGLAQIVAITLMAVFIPSAAQENATGFILSYCIVRALIAFEYLRAGIHNHEGRALAHRHALGFGIGILVWLISLLLPPILQPFAWIVGIFIDLAIPLSAQKLYLQHPPHFSHLPERFGLFTIIVLGEAISSVVTSISRIGLDFTSSLTSFFGLITAFAIWWIYFDAAHGADERKIETQEQVHSYQLWLYSHLPLQMGIVVVGIGFKQAVLLPMGEMFSQAQAFSLSIGLAVTLLSLGAISQSRPNRQPTYAGLIKSIVPLIHAALAAALGLAYTRIPAIGFAFCLALLASLQVCFTLLEENQN